MGQGEGVHLGMFNTNLSQGNMQSIDLSGWEVNAYLPKRGDGLIFRLKEKALIDPGPFLQNVISRNNN